MAIGAYYMIPDVTAERDAARRYMGGLKTAKKNAKVLTLDRPDLLQTKTLHRMGYTNIEVVEREWNVRHKQSKFLADKPIAVSSRDCSFETTVGWTLQEYHEGLLNFDGTMGIKGYLSDKLHNALAKGLLDVKPNFTTTLRMYIGRYREPSYMEGMCRRATEKLPTEVRDDFPRAGALLLHWLDKKEIGILSPVRMFRYSFSDLRRFKSGAWIENLVLQICRPEKQTINEPKIIIDQLEIR